MENKPKMQIIVPHFFIRSFTNNKERAKQYFCIVKSDELSEALLIRKLVLSEDLRLYHDYMVIKEFKTYYLFQKTFSIRITTLKKVMNVLAQKGI